MLFYDFVRALNSFVRVIATKINTQVDWAKSLIEAISTQSFILF